MIHVALLIVYAAGVALSVFLLATILMASLAVVIGPPCIILTATSAVALLRATRMLKATTPV